MEHWELVVRESCRDTMARYNHAGDRFLLEQLAATFCDDGVLEVRGSDTLRGRAAIIGFLSGGRGSTDEEIRRAARAEQAGSARRLVRHLVTNVRFDVVSQREVRATSYFTVVTEIGLDHAGRYRDVLVPVGESWLFALRSVSTDWWAPDSRFARRPSS
jgi:SnoaL-like domain